MAEGGAQFGSGGGQKPQLFLPGAERTGQQSDGTGTGANGDNHTENKGNAADGKTPADNARAEVYNSGPKPQEGTNNGQGNRPTGLAEKIVPPAGGALASGQGNLNAERNPVKSQEAKPAAPGALENKALSAPQQQAAAATEKTSPVVGKSQAEPPKELIASSPYAKTNNDQSIQPQGQPKRIEADQNPPTHHKEDKDQTATSARALAQSDRNTTDNQQTKTNTVPGDKPNEPIGRSGNQKIESQPPPAQQAKPLETNYQSKPTASEAKPEPRSIPIPTPIDVQQPQKNQNPISPVHQPESAPIASQKDLSTKPVDPKMQLGEIQKPITSDGKVASEALKDTKSESTRSPEIAGAGADKNSPGNGPIAHEQPSTKESNNPNGGTQKGFDVAQENTTMEARGDKIQSPSQIRTAEDIATGRLDTTLIEKNREHPLDNMVVPVGRTDGKEPIARQPEATREPKVDNQSDKDKSADVVHKTETRLPGSEVASGSMGIGFDGRPGRGNDKSEQKAEAIERGEVFTTLDGKPVRLDLTNKETCKQLLDLINQIETNKFKALDQTGRERLALLVELEPKSRTALKDILQAFVLKDKPVELELARTLMTDKIDPALARQTKELADGRVDDAHKLQRLEAKEKAARNFLTSFANHVFEAFNRVVNNARNSVRATEPEPKSVDDILQEAHSDKMSTISAVEQATSEEREQLLEKLATFSAPAEDIDVAPNSDVEVEKDAAPGVTLTTQDEDGTYRDVYAVKAGETYKSIAVKSFDDGERLEQLLKEINKPAAAYLDDRIVPAGLIAGQIIYLPTNTECKLFLAKLDAKGGVS